MSQSDRDNSVLFSLNELMSIERERLVQEEQSARQRAEQERTRLAAQKAAAEQAERERLAAVEHAQRQEVLARQAQEDRRLAEREQAELRVRLETEAKSQAAAQAQLLAHEREMAHLEATQRKSKTARIFAAFSLLAVLGASIGGVLFVRESARQEQARSEASARELRALQERADRQAAADRARTQEVIDRATQAAQRAADLQRQTQALLSQSAQPRTESQVRTRPTTRTVRPHTDQSLQIDTNAIERFDRLGD
jgi:colicin import membrane protein